MTPVNSPVHTPAPTRPHIAVIGLMGAGKSTLATAISSALGRVMRDSDVDIETLVGQTGREIALSGGIDSLHRLEEAVLLGALAATELDAWFVSTPARDSADAADKSGPEAGRRGQLES